MTDERCEANRRERSQRAQSMAILWSWRSFAAIHVFARDWSGKGTVPCNAWCTNHPWVGVPGSILGAFSVHSGCVLGPSGWPVGAPGPRTAENGPNLLGSKRQENHLGPQRHDMHQARFGVRRFIAVFVQSDAASRASSSRKRRQVAALEKVQSCDNTRMRPGTTFGGKGCNHRTRIASRYPLKTCDDRLDEPHRARKRKAGRIFM